MYKLKQLLANYKSDYPTDILVTNMDTNEDIFIGNISSLSDELLNVIIYAWDKNSGVYITRNYKNEMIDRLRDM